MINWSKFLIEFSGPAAELDVSAGAQAAGVVTASMMTEETVENSSIFLADSPSRATVRRRLGIKSRCGRPGPAAPPAGAEATQQACRFGLGFQVSDSAAGSGPEQLSRLADSDLGFNLQAAAASVAGSPEGLLLSFQCPATASRCQLDSEEQRLKCSSTK
jgi:hypothetical protein